MLRAAPKRWSCKYRALKVLGYSCKYCALRFRRCSQERASQFFSSSPEDAEIDKGHNDYVEPPDEDVEETDGVVGRQVYVGAGVQEVCVVLPHLNNYNISR